MKEKKQNGKTFDLQFLICFAVFGILFTGRSAGARVISEGVYIDGVYVGGMTKKQAAREEEDYLASLKQTEVTVYVNGHKVTATLNDLGLTAGESCVEKALNVGRTGNLIQRYMDLQDAKEETLEYRHALSLDSSLVETFVKNKCSTHNIPARNARIHQNKQGERKIRDSSNGSIVVEDETAEKIERTILDDWDRSSDLAIEAIVIEDMAAFTSETAAQCKDLLGSYTTEYKTSGKSRIANIENGARLIDGTILFPGQECSVYKKLSPITEENGYEKAGSYAGGKVVQSVGGGVCQVSTTLYNAVLLAELDVTQRNEHSMVVKYVDLAMDAAIAGTYKDLKFVNNLIAPVYIEAEAENKEITFRIWGQETRPKTRSIEFVTEILEEIEPGEDVVEENPDILSGSGYVSQEAYKGYRADLYKVVKEDGKEDQKILINHSTYAAAPRYVVVGTKRPDEDKKEEKEKHSNRQQKR